VWSRTSFQPAFTRALSHAGSVGLFRHGACRCAARGAAVCAFAHGLITIARSTGSACASRLLVTCAATLCVPTRMQALPACQTCATRAARASTTSSPSGSLPRCNIQPCPLHEEQPDPPAHPWPTRLVALQACLQAAGHGPFCAISCLASTPQMPLRTLQALGMDLRAVWNACLSDSSWFAASRAAEEPIPAD